MLPKILVSFNDNKTVLVNFSPSEATWEFPNGKKLNLFNELYAILNPQIKVEHYNANTVQGDKWSQPSTDLEITAEQIKSLLARWVEAGNLIIK